jgi:hypothetical protein
MVKVKGHDIGKGLAILAHFYLTEAHYHADVSAWHAPGECHDVVSKHEDRRLREVWRHIKGVTGLKKKAFQREVARRTGSGKVLYRVTMGALLRDEKMLRRKYPLFFSWPE